MLLGPLGFFVAELSAAISIARIKEKSRKRWDGTGISLNELKSGGLRLAAFAEVRRKTACKDALREDSGQAGAPGSGRMGRCCNHGLAAGLAPEVAGDSRLRVKSWA